MSQKQPSRTPQFKPNRRQKWLNRLMAVIVLIALGSVYGLITPNRTRNPSVKLNSPLQIIQGIIPDSLSPAIHSTNSRLQNAWQSTLQQADGHVSIAVYSKKDDHTYTAANAINHPHPMASTVKVSILVGLLMKNKTLTPSQQVNAQAMIENSSNNATNALLSDLGGTKALQNTFKQLGMNHTKAHKQWGLSTTTASDQIKLLNTIFYDSNLLTSGQQQYVQTLMENVEGDQRWGISAGSSNFALKNGWLEIDDGWIINSIGYIPGTHGTSDSYTIAVYTDNNSTMKDGENTIAKLAKATSQILN